MIDFPGVYETPGAGDYEMSALLSECGNFHEALVHIDQALASADSLADPAPATAVDANSIFYAKAVSLRCTCLAGLDRHADAVAESAPFVDIYRAWEDRRVKGATEDLAALYSARAEWLYEMGAPRRAFESAREAVKRFGQLASQVSPIFRPPCAEALRRMAEYCYEAAPESLGSELEAAFPYEDMTGRPSTELPRVADEELREAKKLLRRNEKEPAEEHLDFATAHYLRLFSSNFHWGTDLTAVYYFHLTLRLSAKKPLRALLDPSRRALECARRMYDADPARHRENYRKTLQWRIHALDVNEQVDEADVLRRVTLRMRGDED
ncbi:hypothetical protein [Salininema proteolyticum]|uniref:Uncharacterized protein n=1 Tax=Salininema proteolyticum TaxID=1607685 RepID=A0ABV8TXE6_9ACTN